MDYEKKYKNALEWARQVMTGETGFIRKEVEDIFPELKESEDERIKKAIIATIHLYYGEPLEDKAKEMIAWLEKQGGQKPIDTCDSSIINGKEFPASEKRDFGYFSEPADKVEPKFKVGDKVHLINGSSPNYEDDCIIIDEISNNTYYGNWEGGYFAIKDQDRYELVEQKPAFEMKTPEESLGIDSDTYNKIVDECVYGEQISANETPYPETLEEAIDLYYYSYGNGEGEFEHLSLEKFRYIVHTFVSDYGQKPAWSEEEEKLVKNLISTLSNLYARNLIEKETKEKYTNLLKSLKDRYTWKPSDEQMKAIKWIIDGDNPENWSITIENLYQDLKKLREK